MDENLKKEDSAQAVLDQTSEDVKVPVNSSKLKFYLIAIIAVLLVAAIGLFVSKSQRNTTTQTQNVISRPSLSPVPTLPRSKAPGIITEILTSKSVDLKTGQAVNPTSVFLSTDNSIYLVAMLKNAKSGMKIEYVRYLNNKFLDNRSLTVSKSNVNTASFLWSLKKKGSAHLLGNYRVKVYTNGIFEKEITYTVQ